MTTPDRLIKPSAVRRFALTQARLTGRKFTRVGSAFLDAVEAAVRTTVAARVHAAKGGKTL